MIASASAWFPMPVWLLVLLALFAVYTVSRRRSLRRRLDAKLQSLSEEIDRLNSRYLELRGHMFFETGVKNRLAGVSLATLDAAHDLKSCALGALDCLKHRHAEAKKLSRKGSGLSRTLQDTFRLLSVTPVVVAGKEYPPSTLAEQVNRWFDEASSRLDVLSRALRQTTDERKEAAARLRALSRRLNELAGQEIRSLELGARFEKLELEVASSTEQSITDPVSMAPQATALRAQVDELAAEVEALAHKRDSFVAAFGSDRENLERLLREVAGRRIIYAFPCKPEEVPPWKERSMPVDELTGSLLSADQAKERALEALSRGLTGVFAGESEHALRLTGSALKQFRHLGLTKDKVDSLAVLTAAAAERLAGGLATAAEVLERLSGEFAREDLVDLSERLGIASAVSARALPDLACAKAHYDGVRFGDALQVVQRLSDDIVRAEESIEGFDARAGELQSIRAQVQSTAARHRGAFDSLSKKVSLCRHAVSADTACRFEQLEQFFARISSGEGGWLKAHEISRNLGKTLKLIQSDCDREKSLYEKALEKLELCRDLVQVAGRAASQASSRRVARDKLAECTRLFELLERDMRTPASDWVELAKHADEIVPLAREATRRGNYDQQKFTAAEQCLASARIKKQALGEYADGVLATGKMLAACKALAEAEVAMTDRRFEDAGKLAAQADQSFQGSLNARGMTA